MRAHLDGDADSELVLAVRGTAGSVHDGVEANTLLYGEETVAWAYTGYQGAGKRPDGHGDLSWNVAIRPGKRQQLDKMNLMERIFYEIECIKYRIRVQLEHVKFRYRGLTKNAAQLHTFFALANLRMVKHRFQGVDALVILKLTWLAWKTARDPGI